MQLQYVRPSAFDLAFRLYERAIHPELFDVFAATRSSGRDWSADIRVSVAGHIVEFRGAGQNVTEVTGPVSLSLPERGLCVGHRLGGSKDWTFSLESGLKVHFSAHVEAVDPEVFRNLDQELSLDARDATLSHRFPGGHRLQPGPLSVIQIESLTHGVLIHAFHTFPENFAVLRTQSLYETGAG
ncbi:MAG: DUF2617 family protein [Planctomyces sp.]|nr:DUF2617 family protein [Planctomyces sp.]